MRRRLWAVLFGGLVLVGAARNPLRPADPLPADRAPRVRQPVALVLADAGQWLFAANRRSGTISVIDTRRLLCVAEVGVGRGLSGLAALPDGGHLLATDEEANE